MITGITGQFGRVLRYGQIFRPLPGAVSYHGRRVASLDGHPVRVLELTAPVADWQALIEDCAPKVILHLAGATYTSGLDLEGLVALNMSCACNVAQAADNAGVKSFFYASTAGVYGPQAEDAAPWTEDTALRPTSDYARSKAMGEDALRALAPKLDLAISCLRYATTGGSDMLVRNALKATPDAPLLLDQFPDGTSPERSYLGPQDLVDMHHGLCALPSNQLPDVLNIAPRGALQMHDLLEALPAAFKTPISWKFRPAGLQAVKRNVLSSQRLERTLGQDIPRTNAQSLAHQIKAFLDAKLPLV